MPLTDLTYSALEFIALNLREQDRIEIFGVLEHDSPLQLAFEAHYLLKNKGRSAIAWHKGRPAAWIGLVEHRPRVWDVTMGGTDDLKHVALEIMRWCRTTIPELVKPPHNGRRLQCDSRVGHDEAHKFIRALGGREESTMRHYGKDGSSYIRFVWIYGENGTLINERAVGVPEASTLVH
jgi:hypothetical protein